MQKVWACVLFCSLPAGAWANGAVYAMTNTLGNNEVLVYSRGDDGSLTSTPVQTISTGGGGSGLQLAGIDALGSAGSVQLDEKHRLLFALNTESANENNGAGAYNTDCHQGTITSFLVGNDGTLTFVDRVFSRGMFPDSLTVKNGVIYVLNAGGPETAICNGQPATSNAPNITGFLVDKSGQMEPVGSTQSIDPGPATGSGESCSATSASGFSGLTGAPAAAFLCGLNPPSFPRSPAQVRFTPKGDQLVVTVKGTNTIYIFPVDSKGNAGSPAITQASGFTFDNIGNLLVAEAFGSATAIPAGAAGALSSFMLTKAGGPVPLSPHVSDGGTWAGWVALEPIAGNYAYVSNNLSASISSYSLGIGGIVTLLNGTAASGSGPNDLATAQENGVSFLYVVDAGTGTVGAFQINLANGSLTALNGGTGLPAGRSAQGLAAY